MSATGHHLTTYRWKMLRKRVISEERICWICGLPPDFDAPPMSPRSPTVDHVVPRSLGGDMWDRSNLRLACHGCNSKRQAGTPRPGRAPMRNSRVW